MTKFSWINPYGNNGPNRPPNNHQIPVPPSTTIWEIVRSTGAGLAGGAGGGALILNSHQNKKNAIERKQARKFEYVKALGKREIGPSQFLKDGINDGWTYKELEEDIRNTANHLRAFPSSELDTRFAEHLEETANKGKFSARYDTETKEINESQEKSTSLMCLSQGDENNWSVGNDELMENLPGQEQLLEILLEPGQEKETLADRSRVILVDSEGNPLPGKSPMNDEEFMRFKDRSDNIENIVFAATTVSNLMVSAFQAALYWALVGFLVAVINYSARWLFYLLQQRWNQHKKGK